MPIYEYVRAAGGQRCEAWQQMSEKPVAECPACPTCVTD
jgi:putative FmdB family regulatory protein